MFRTVPLSIIRSSVTLHSAVVYVIQVSRHLSSRTSWSCSRAAYKPVWLIPLLSVEWMNSWWWTEELSESCRVSSQNKFCEISASSWFYYKEIVMMRGHTNVKFVNFHIFIYSKTYLGLYIHTFRGLGRAARSKALLCGSVQSHI